MSKYAKRFAEEMGTSSIAAAPSSSGQESKTVGEGSDAARSNCGGEDNVLHEDAQQQHRGGSGATASSERRSTRLERRGGAHPSGAAPDHPSRSSPAMQATAASAVEAAVPATGEEDDIDRELSEGRADSSGHEIGDDVDLADVEDGAARRLYACDVCPHLVFYTPEALREHAVSQHHDIFPDHARLFEVSSKLVPLWAQVKERKRDAIAAWGRKIFRIARQRDAGPAKMAEAHRAREQLELVVRRWNPNARVFIFGSSVAFGVWDGISDIDFAVVDVAAVEAGAWPPQERNAVRSITELLRRAGFSYINLEPIPHARVPIIKHHASAPIRLPAAPQQQRDGDGDGDDAAMSPEEADEASRLEAEDVIARSVRYVLTAPASPQDRVVLEGSVRDAVGADAVQQVWWNRTGEMMCLTCSSTTAAIQAAICGLSFVTPGLRAKAQPLHDECRPELHNTDFDLSFRVFGIRNSELLNRYLTAHPCARPGAIVLKDWSKTSGVNNSLNGYLTSYAVNIMWIYFLVHKGVIPYVDPLNDVPASLVGRENFGPVYRPMAAPDATEAELAQLYSEAGELLLDFFFFYAHEFDWQHHVVSLNRPGITTKQMLGWDVEDTMAGATAAAAAAGPRKGAAVRYSFCIEDPYEENLNLGRHMGISKAIRVQTELHRALVSLLKDGDGECCVFASTDRADAAAAADGSDGDGAAPLLGGGSGQLPLRVLARLTGVAMREMALAAQQEPQHSPSTTGAAAAAGLREEQLLSAFRARAPLEFAVASKAWNWQQLLHRLGYRLHRGTVVRRREVGTRRARATPQQPQGAEPAEKGTAASTTTTTTTAPPPPQQQQPVDAMGLSERMAAALASGFLRLTPEWVAWSAPWAALHLRGHRLFTPADTTSTTASTTSTATSTATASASPPHDGALAGGGGGALRGTAPRLMSTTPPLRALVKSLLRR